VKDVVKHKFLMITLSFYIYNYNSFSFSFSLLVMNTEPAREYNSFSLLANLEKNKVFCQAMFILIRHSSPLPTWALSLSLLRSQKPPPPPPPQSIRLQISTRCFLFYYVFFFKKKDLRLCFHLFNWNHYPEREIRF